METRRDFRTSSKKELLYYYANSVYNTHYGRVIAQRRDPYFSSLAKIAMALDLTLDKFMEGVK